MNPSTFPIPVLTALVTCVMIPGCSAVVVLSSILVVREMKVLCNHPVLSPHSQAAGSRPTETAEVTWSSIPFA